jgi:hypothetical protein
LFGDQKGHLFVEKALSMDNLRDILTVKTVDLGKQYSLV